MTDTRTSRQVAQHLQEDYVIINWIEDKEICDAFFYVYLTSKDNMMLKSFYSSRDIHLRSQPQSIYELDVRKLRIYTP